MNILQIATLIVVGYVTNIIERPSENGPRGNTWFRTNVISAVTRVTRPGLPPVTNIVPVATNVLKLTIVTEAVPAPSLSQRERAGVRESRPTTPPLTASQAATLGWPPLRVWSGGHIVVTNLIYDWTIKRSH